MSTVDDERKKLLEHQISALNILSKEASMICNVQRQVAESKLPEIIPRLPGDFPFPAQIDVQVRRFMTLGPYSNLTGAKSIDKEIFKTKGCELLINLIENGLGAIIAKEAFEAFLSSPKQEYALFALALCAKCKLFVIVHSTGGSEDVAGNLEIKEKFKEYLSALQGLGTKSVNIVIRSGGHLLDFIHYCKLISERYGKTLGWGRAMKREVAAWYQRGGITMRKTMLEVLKYKSRHGWTHRDVFKCCHPSSKDLHPIFDIMFHFIVTGEVDEAKLPLIHVHKEDQWEETVQRMSRFIVKTIESHIAIQKLKNEEDVPEAVRLIHEGELPVNSVPSELLKYREIWIAVQMPFLMKLKHLGRLSALGVISGDNPENDERIRELIESFVSHAGIYYSRIHPMNFFIALKAYEAGKSRHLTWTVNRKIVEGLNAGLTRSFIDVSKDEEHKAEMKMCVAVNISDSMNENGICGTMITAKQAAAGLTKVFLEVEDSVKFVKYFDQVEVMNLKKKMLVSDIEALLDVTKRGEIDSAAAVAWALEKKKKFDVFVLLTDSKVYANTKHFHESFQRYKKKMNMPETKLVVVGLTNSESTLADPEDEYMLDVVGFDVSLYHIIHKFARGQI